MSKRYDKTFTDSPEWAAWERELELNPVSRYDIERVKATGWISVDHFQAFARFAAHQHEMKLSLQFQDKILGLRSIEEQII